jgi:hypothetical protein
MLGVNPNAERQQEDFYATEPKALQIFLDKLEKDGISLNNKIWEPSCGMGHLSDVLVKRGYDVRSTDIVDRGYEKFEGRQDFLVSAETWFGDILTNPPFKLAEKFVEQIDLLGYEDSKLILFLKIQFLEGQKRKELFKKYPPKYVYCNSSRQLCAKDGEFEKYTATTQFYAWYVWENGFSGDTIVRWI